MVNNNGHASTSRIAFHYFSDTRVSNYLWWIRLEFLRDLRHARPKTCCRTFRLMVNGYVTDAVGWYIHDGRRQQHLNRHIWSRWIAARFRSLTSYLCSSSLRLLIFLDTPLRRLAWNCNRLHIHRFRILWWTTLTFQNPWSELQQYQESNTHLDPKLQRSHKAFYASRL
jgi:hypothetical protein